MKALLRVMGLLSPFLYEVALSLLLGVAAIAANIGLLGTAAFLIASAALHPSIAELQVAIVGVRFFGISRGVFRYLERLVSHSLNLRLTARLRVDFYRRIEPGAPVNLQTRRSGDLLGRAMGDLETLENFYVRALAPVVVALVVTVGMSLILGGYLPEIGLIMAAGLLVNGFLLLVGMFAPASFLSHFIVFVLSVFIGFQVIWNVSHSLHTPLMAVTNAISGIVILGALLQIGSGNWLVVVLGALSVLIATINIVGGFLVTRRMLAMFQKS